MRSVSFVLASASVIVCVVTSGCSGTKTREATPLAPTSTGITGSSGGAAGGSSGALATGVPGATRPQGGSMGLLPGMSGPSDVIFPDRRDAYMFRSTDLERIYRDSLKHPPFSTYVDPEGSVVWVSEYLRYRVNQCSHQAAFDRILTQVGGGGVPPVCGQQQQPFPGREEAYQFRLQLESVYRDTAGRQPGQTYVNAEGDVIWTMEYLRYRLSGCDHGSTVQKISDQIAQRGVPADCSRSDPPPPPPPTVSVDFTMNPSPCPLRQEGANTRTLCQFDASVSRVPGRVIAYKWTLNDGFERSTTTPVFGGWAVPCGTLPTVRLEVRVGLTIDTSEGSYPRTWPVLFENNNGC